MFIPNIDKNVNFEDFFGQYPLITYEKGEKILRPNELETNVIYIKTGFLKIYSLSSEGKEIIINIINAELYKNSLIFGVASYINNYSIQALNQVQVLRAPREKFEEFMEQHPSGYCNLLSPLSLCLKSVYAQIEWLKNGNAFYKVASVVNYLGKQTGRVDNNTVTIGFKITHQIIANLTGITRETVTVQLNKLRDMDLIEYEDTIVKIKNVRRLLQEIESLN